MSATVTVRDLCLNTVAYHGRLLISFGEASKRSTLSVALRGFRRRAGRAFPYRIFQGLAWLAQY